MGPVTPLLAIVEAWRKKDSHTEFIWVGTPHGPERASIEAYGIPFLSLPVARLPRHPSVEWFTFPFVFLFAWFKSIIIISKQMPDLIASAGGYTSVPVVFAGRMFGIPSWLHQQDVRPILTSRILAPWVDRITVAWEQSLSAFPHEKTKWIGNPARSSVLKGSKETALKEFGLDPNKPTVLIVGGGTGSVWINQAMDKIAPKLVVSANILHLSGKGKHFLQGTQIPGWRVIDFLKEMNNAYAVADLVVSRAGMGAITELSALSKAVIFIPLPHSAQEDNVRVLADAVEVMEQDTSPDRLLHKIETLLVDVQRRKQLGEKLFRLLRTDVADEIVEMLKELIKKHTR